MGCDIHMYVEKKVENVWQPVKGPNKYYGEFHWENEKYTLTWAYHGRNYDLFSLLADVRNDGYIAPISYPRGLPNDISDLIYEESERWGIDGHSHSFFTVEELIEEIKEEELKENLINTEFFQKTIPLLKKLAKEEPENVRIVFWFDN